MRIVVTLHSQVWTSETWKTSYFCYGMNMNQIYTLMMVL